MAVWAIVDSDGVVSNTIEWDKQAQPSYEDSIDEGSILVQITDGMIAGKGYTYKDGKFSPPEPTEEEIRQTEEQNKASNIATKESLLSSATQSIVVYQTKLMIGRKLTDKETNLLNSWLDYIDALEAIDAETSDVIAWPASP